MVHYIVHIKCNKNDEIFDIFNYGEHARLQKNFWFCGILNALEGEFCVFLFYVLIIIALFFDSFNIAAVSQLIIIIFILNRLVIVQKLCDIFNCENTLQYN